VASAAFAAAVDVVAFEHPLEDLLLELLHLGIGERNLVLDRVVLLVGLHRHRLLAELRQPALLHGRRPSRSRAARSGSRRAVPWRCQATFAALFDASLERPLPLRFVASRRRASCAAESSAAAQSAVRDQRSCALSSCGVQTKKAPALPHRGFEANSFPRSRASLRFALIDLVRDLIGNL
jgi:hypothetical protein